MSGEGIPNIPITPMVTAVIQTTGTPAASVTAVTPGDKNPDVVVEFITPLLAITVRFLNAFFTTLTGLIVAAMASNAAGSNVIHATTFMHLVVDCATLSVAGAGVGLLKDFVTIFSKLEQKFPLATGNV